MSTTKKKGAMKAVSAKEQADLIDIIVKGKAQSIAPTRPPPTAAPL